MSILLKNILRFVLLLGVQIFVLNQIMLYGLVNPYLYLIFILLLPFKMPRWLLLLFGLALGLSLDAFMNTMGMHAFACVLMAYLRPWVLKILSPQGGFEASQKAPSPGTMGLSQFTTYVIIMVLIHHIAYFTLEVFGWGNLSYLLAKILLSSLVSIGLILIYELLFYKAERKYNKT
ncbi:MAG: rod shape-determining protein MreD [Chitinophagaceae bacterium]